MMEFTVPQGRLSSALARASTATGRGKVAEILSCVLLRATDEGLVVAATDMQVGYTELIPCKVEGRGSVTIKASSLTSMVRLLPAGEVKAKALDNSWLQLVAGKTEAKLMGLSGVDFPALPDPSSAAFIEAEAASIADLISKTLFSVCTEENRVNINGALVEREDGSATMVSTDGHRLTKYTSEVAWPALGDGVIVPRRGLEEIRKLLSQVENDCSIGVADGHLFVRADNVTLSVKLNNVTFPPWQQVVPKDYKTRATVSRTDLLAALRQAVVIAPNKTQTVKMTVTPSKLILQANNELLGAVRLEVEATWSGKGEINVGINGEYLADSLSVIESDDVELRFQSELDPVVAVPASEPKQELVSVVMPMRI